MIETADRSTRLDSLDKGDVYSVGPDKLKLIGMRWPTLGELADVANDQSAINSGWKEIKARVKAVADAAAAIATAAPAAAARAPKAPPVPGEALIAALARCAAA
eukprot:951883-Prymnesium_polylepis.1